MNGAHRRDGLFVLSGPGVRTAGELGAADIVDVLPTLLALAGLAVPTGLDGRPIAAALERSPSLVDDGAIDDEAPPEQPYDAAESDAVAARLVALGYVEP